MIAAYDMHCNKSCHVLHVVISHEQTYIPPYILSEVVKPHQGWTEK